MTRVLLVGAGGFLGSISRYLLSGIQRTFDANTLQVSAAWRF